MSLTQIIVLVIGIVLAGLGLKLVFDAPTVLFPNLVIGLLLIVVGVVLMIKRDITL